MITDEQIITLAEELNTADLAGQWNGDYWGDKPADSLGNIAHELKLIREALQKIANG